MRIIGNEEAEKKDITLRGVDKELYNQFIAFARKAGIPTGDAFNAVVFRLIKQPWQTRPMRHSGRKFPGTKPEIIRDLETLTVSKKDLTAAGEKTMYLFKNIKELIFSKDVDGPTLAKHVKLISSCNVQFLGDIPKLIHLGLIRKKAQYNYPNSKEGLKDITIRNVIAKLYDEFLAQAKKEGTKTGQYFSEMLANFIPIVEIHEAIIHGRKNPLIISFEEELTVTKADLAGLTNRYIIFYGIPKLTFDKDITKDLFLEVIHKIIRCETVTLPPMIPRLIVLSRAIMCRTIEISD